MGDDSGAADGCDHEAGRNRGELADVRHHREPAQPVLATGRLEEVAGFEGDDDAPAHPREEQRNEVGRQNEAALIEEFFPVERTAGGAVQGRPEEERELAYVGHGLAGAPDYGPTPDEHSCHPVGGCSPIPDHCIHAPTHILNPRFTRSRDARMVLRGSPGVTLASPASTYPHVFKASSLTGCHTWGGGGAWQVDAADRGLAPAA